MAKLTGIDWMRKLEGATLTTAPASDAQTVTGTATDVAVTPASLQAKVASATAKGIAELATNAETIAVTDQARVVTPYGLGAALASIELISFVGKNGAGACTMTGVKAGDVVFSVTGQVAADVGDKSSLFETGITVNDQIQQVSATDLSTKVFMALIYRMS